MGRTHPAPALESNHPPPPHPVIFKLHNSQDKPRLLMECTTDSIRFSFPKKMEHNWGIFSRHTWQRDGGGGGCTTLVNLTICLFIDEVLIPVRFISIDPITVYSRVLKKQPNNILKHSLWGWQFSWYGLKCCQELFICAGMNCAGIDSSLSWHLLDRLNTHDALSPVAETAFTLGWMVVKRSKSKLGGYKWH